MNNYIMFIKHITFAFLFFILLNLPLLAMDDPDPVLTPQDNLIAVLRESSNNAATSARTGNLDHTRLEAFVHLAGGNETNYYEPETYIELLTHNRMTRTNWLDLVQYLGEIHPQRNGNIKIEDAKNYARSFAYAPYDNEDE